MPIQMPPHRENCPCPQYTSGRCYPCRHTGEILTADQWGAMEVYDGVQWRGEGVVEAVKSQFQHQRYLERHPEKRTEWDQDRTDEEIGRIALAVWFAHSPADFVAAIRHAESKAHDGYDCEPAYDDPECLDGTCRHIGCDRQRSYERLALAREAD